MNNIELVEFAKSKLGTPYVYGMKGQVMTLDKYNQLKKQYGNAVWDSDKNKVGKVCCDCSGLISWYTGIIRGSSQYRGLADKAHPISTIGHAPIGALVWQQGHIGIYIGNGKYIAEDGSAYGCRINDISKAKFTHWFLCTDIEYVKEETEMTQEQFNKMMDVYIKSIKAEEVSGWAKEDWDKAVEKNVFDGTMPKAPLTREQAASVLSRLGLL